MDSASPVFGIMLDIIGIIIFVILFFAISPKNFVSLFKHKKVEGETIVILDKDPKDSWGHW